MKKYIPFIAGYNVKEVAKTLSQKQLEEIERARKASGSLKIHQNRPFNKLNLR
jgi:hypothetical protein